MSQPTIPGHDVTFRQLQACACREARLRAAFYPSEVAKGFMTKQEAESRTAIFACIAECFNVLAIAVETDLFGGGGDIALPNAFTFSDMIGAAIGELDNRREKYPRMVKAEKMRQAEADKQTKLMEEICAVLVEIGRDETGYLRRVREMANNEDATA